MKSNHDILKEFHKALKKHRQACFKCENEQKYKSILEHLKTKYVVLQKRGLVTKMVDNICSQKVFYSKKQIFLEYLAFNDPYMWYKISILTKGVSK